MKNYQKVFHPNGIIYVVLSMIMVIVGMAVLFSIASCSQEPVHEHNWGEGVVTKPATCTEAGEKTYTCECGETKTEVIPALGHSWNEGVVTEEPAFMHSGEMLFTCTVCGEKETRVIERGDGTKENPYLITSEEDWNAFADYTLSQNCSGKYFKLTDDISVSRMANACDTDTLPMFRGKLDGDGHTITLTLSSTEFAGGSKDWNKGLALFMTATNGCEIRNLHVDGTITTDRKFAAGFISYVNGAVNEDPNNVVVLENCRSSVTIISSVDGEATSAGFVAVGRNRLDLTLKNCLFDGNFISENGENFSGLIGYHYNITSNPCILTISDCAVILGDETSERLKTEAGSMTFVRHANSLVPVFEGNVFYSGVLGKQDAFGAATKAYLSQADATAAPENVCGTVKTATIAGQNLYYMGDTNHEFNLSDGIITVEPAFMKNGEITYTCTVCGENKVEVIDRGNGTKDNPYLITSEEDWNAFAVYTQSSNCSGTYFKLTDDISVSKMANACATDTVPMFRGKLDGDGHTITLTLSSTEFAGGSKEWNKGLALFMTASNGCEIRNLHVDGTITTDRKFAASFIAYVNGAVNEDPNNVVVLENCRSSVKIISSVTGDATSAGFVAVGRNRLDLTLKNCLFDGNFISEAGTNFSGLIGYHHNITSHPCILTISDCAVILGDETSERLKTEAGSMTFIRHADTFDPVFEGNILYTSVLGGNQDAGEAASLAYLSQADAAEAAGAANKEVGTKVIAGQTLYYVAESAE